MSDEQPPIVSTGRGGSGNIGRDPNVYADAGIVREGFVGEASDGKEYSSGRGGAGNMASPKMGPTKNRRGSQDIIPETALRPGDEYKDYHTGRGGEGNVHREKYGGHSGPHGGESLSDKVKQLFHKDDKKSTAPPADK